MQKTKMEYMGADRSSPLMKKIDNSLLGIYRSIPYTYIGIFRRSFGSLLSSKEKVTMLDLACGDGEITQNLALPKNFEITGVDIYKPYLKIARSRSIYHKLIHANLKGFRPKTKFDVVVAAHVIEHFSKQDAYKFIKMIEQTAKKLVVIACPIGHLEQDTFDNNKYQQHKSEWYPREFEQLGYEVEVQGLKILWGEENIIFKYGILSYLLFFISLLATPILRISKDSGTYMICRKKVDNS